jgi:hypothetical protein
VLLVGGLGTRRGEPPVRGGDLGVELVQLVPQVLPLLQPVGRSAQAGPGSAKSATGSPSGVLAVARRSQHRADQGTRRPPVGP